MPPRPNGNDTTLIIPHRVDPRANAPSRSPIGTWLNTSRITEHWIGITIMATTIPAMKLDAVYTLALDKGLLGSAPVTVKPGTSRARRSASATAR